jgi:hypothetical protein
VAVLVVKASKIRNGVLLGMAVAMFAIAAAWPAFGVAPIAVALICLLVLGTSLSDAGRLSKTLRPFRNRPVEIRVWGEPLPGQAETCQIESIRALGAGVHFFVRRSGRLGHLKIAQPRGSHVGESAAEISEAKYVQREGRNLPRAAGAPAVTVVVRG